MRNSRHSVEVSAGLFLLLGFATLLFLALRTTDRGGVLQEGGFPVYATFTNVGGLKEKAPVTIAGVTIGAVDSIELDPVTFEAQVTLSLSDQLDIPTDSSLSILTRGLLGGQYVGLEPGGAEEYLKAGDEIFLTQSAVILEQLISKYLFSSGEDGAEEESE